MKEHRVEPVRPAPNGRFADHGPRSDFASAPLQVQYVAFHRLVNPAPRRGQHVVQGSMRAVKQLLLR